MNYSIIIPHKNTPILLERCLNSIPVRKDIEVIVIDDNSNPSEVEPLKNFEKNRLNVEVILSKDGKGAGYARNIGLKRASGKWTLFLDADDFFTKDAFLCFDSYINSKSDLIYFMMDSCFSDTLEKADRHLVYSSIISEYLYDNKSNDDNLRYKMSGPVAKMIKSEVIIRNNLKFEEVIASNDIMFSTKVGYYASTVCADNRTVYTATIRYGSLTKTRTKEIQYCRYLVQIRYNIFVKKIGKPHIQKHLTSRIIESLIYFGLREFLKYMHVAIKNRINIFLGFSHFSSSLKNWTLRKLDHDKYLKK
jgi:glycosyltransferase involved in cell wall biosynthesis